MEIINETFQIENLGGEHYIGSKTLSHDWADVTFDLSKSNGINDPKKVIEDIISISYSYHIWIDSKFDKLTGYIELLDVNNNVVAKSVEQKNNSNNNTFTGNLVIEDKTAIKNILENGNTKFKIKVHARIYDGTVIDQKKTKEVSIIFNYNYKKFTFNLNGLIDGKEEGVIGYTDDNGKLVKGGSATVVIGNITETGQIDYYKTNTYEYGTTYTIIPENVAPGYMCNSSQISGTITNDTSVRLSYSANRVYQGQKQCKRIYVNQKEPIAIYCGQNLIYYHS